MDFNNTINITARAWDEEGQAGADVVSVTVNNSGATSITDGFEDAANGGFFKWRRIDNNHEIRFFVGNYGSGSNTWWETRTSPGTPAPLGSGKEAYVKSSDTAVNHTANQILRSQRINATGFTRPIQVKFFYRARDTRGIPNALMLMATTDEGATWETLEYLPMTTSGSSTPWEMFSGTYSLQGENVYFALKYGGRFRESQHAGASVNLDDIVIRECPSDPPVVSWTNPADGADVSGSTDFDVDATDDGSVQKVFFYMNGSLVSTDTAAPWRYTRNTANDDNHPAIKVIAYALDNDDIASEKAEITVAFKNSKNNYPAHDDIETGLDGQWLIENDGIQPQWQLVTDDGRSGTQCLGWIAPDSWGGAPNDYAWFRGESPASGRHSIDLSGDDVIEPLLKYYYKMNTPSSRYFDVYFYTTWLGYTKLDTMSIDQADWTLAENPLSAFIGHSGRLLFYPRGSTGTGTGIFIDDISVENSGPFITEVSPARGVVGDSITISGSGFGDTQGAGEVRFNNGAGGHVSQASVTSWSNNEIVCDIPSGAKSHATDGIWVFKITESIKKPFTVVLPTPNLTGAGKID